MPDSSNNNILTLQRLECVEVVAKQLSRRIKNVVFVHDGVRYVTSVQRSQAKFSDIPGSNISSNCQSEAIHRLAGIHDDLGRHCAHIKWKIDISAPDVA